MKRFYETATATREEGGFAVRLDDRPIRTPGRSLLIVPSLELAEAVAGEWAAQDETIRPNAMPLTRLANTAIDQLPARRADALAEIMGYASADLLCYREAAPAELARRQALRWQPWLDWSASQLGARLVTTTTLDPLPQPAESLAVLERVAAGLDDWHVVGLHAASRLTSSIVLGLAMLQGRLAAAEAFELALLEELFEIERWGLEEEQAKRHAGLRTELNGTELFCRALGPSLDRPTRGK